MRHLLCDKPVLSRQDKLIGLTKQRVEGFLRRLLNGRDLYSTVKSSYSKTFNGVFLSDCVIDEVNILERASTAL